MRAGACYIVVELATDILLANVPSCGVGKAYGHGGVEHATASEEIMHPSAAEEIGHDGFGVGNAIGISELSGFLRFADVLAIGVVEAGHPASSECLSRTTTDCDARMF